MRLTILAALLAGFTVIAIAQPADRCANSGDLRLTNGRIHTMEAQDRVVSEATIQAGKFVVQTTNLDPCTRTIDLQGKTVVPGLIDNHNHIVLLGLRPGYDTRLETAASIADVQAAIRVRAR